MSHNWVLGVEVGLVSQILVSLQVRRTLPMLPC